MAAVAVISSLVMVVGLSVVSMMQGKCWRLASSGGSSSILIRLFLGCNIDSCLFPKFFIETSHKSCELPNTFPQIPFLKRTLARVDFWRFEPWVLTAMVRNVVTMKMCHSHLPL